jgi:hypothetical protein
VRDSDVALAYVDAPTIDGRAVSELKAHRTRTLLEQRLMIAGKIIEQLRCRINHGDPFLGVWRCTWLTALLMSRDAYRSSGPSTSVDASTGFPLEPRP